MASALCALVLALAHSEARGLVSSTSVRPHRAGTVGGAGGEDGDSARRGGWDVGRFAKTALFFGAFAPPNPLKALRRALAAPSPRMVFPGDLIYSPSKNPQVEGLGGEGRGNKVSREVSWRRLHTAAFSRMNLSCVSSVD